MLWGGREGGYPASLGSTHPSLPYATPQGSQSQHWAAAWVCYVAGLQKEHIQGASGEMRFREGREKGREGGRGQAPCCALTRLSLGVQRMIWHLDYSS